MIEHEDDLIRTKIPKNLGPQKDLGGPGDGGTVV
jgi:hypothetical protein